MQLKLYHYIIARQLQFVTSRWAISKILDVALVVNVSHLQKFHVVYFCVQCREDWVEYSCHVHTEMYAASDASFVDVVISWY